MEGSVCIGLGNAGVQAVVRAVVRAVVQAVAYPWCCIGLCLLWRAPGAVLVCACCGVPLVLPWSYFLKKFL